MSRSTKDLEHDTLDANDGEIAHVEDFTFDATAWVVRYLGVKTGSWLSGRAAPDLSLGDHSVALA